MTEILRQHENFFEEASKEARKSLCLRDKCGAIIVLNGNIIGKGYNAPPNDDTSRRMCKEDLVATLNPKSDRTCCVHAEWRAIIDAIKNKKDISGSTLYFIRVDSDGNLLKSGKPYCTVCSRLALDTKIKYFALWHDEGIKIYDTKEYDKLSYDFHSKN
ncbi:MAG: hypothetical protein Q7K16_02990 [Candidatus Azambacteria bacterium]|nr:hypothetical protein [Candidatus Azambacteria bacterium]